MNHRPLFAVLCVGLATACGSGTSTGASTRVEPEPRASAPEPAAAAEPYRCQVSQGYDDDPNNDTTHYDFDADGRVAAIESQSGPSAATDTVRFDYDASGRATRRRYEAWQENGTAPETPAASIRWAPGDGPRQLVEERDAGNTSVRITWTFDAAGHVTRVETHSRTVIPEDERAPGDPAVSESRRHHDCTWDATGRPTSMVVAEGPTRRWTYADEGAWPIRETFEFEGDPPAEATVTVTDDGVEVRNGDEGTYRIYRGRCEDAFFAGCSPAFAPPPPGESRIPIPRLR